MRRPLARTLTSLALTAPVAVAIACGKGDGPTAPSARQLTAHFDSLYVAAILAGTHGDSLRSLVITYLEVATAQGATPVPVTVTTTSGTEKWQALSFEIADTSGNPNASTIAATIAYSDANATNAVFSEVITGAGAKEYAEMVAADTIYAATTQATALETVTNSGSRGCPSPSGYSNPIFAAADSLYHCNAATFEASLNATFPSTPGIDPALTHVSFSDLTSYGVRYSDANP